MPAESKTQHNPWWRGAVIYQIYPRSFMDSNADGVGDLPGITARLDHVAELGVDAIWVSPFFVSPMTDFGYDVSDYRGVDPLFGTLEDFAALVSRAHDLGLKVIIDQVLSHTSDQHAWFAESRVSRHNPKSDWYVWADPAAGGGPPNNWLSVFGGPAWTFDDDRGQYYLHNFLTSQPDLNFHNPEVQAAQLGNVQFWLELGVDGFRFDVVNFYFHDASLANNPRIARGTSPHANASPHNPYYEQRHEHDIDQPENVDYLQQIRALLDAYGATTSIGEISSDDSLGVMAEYTGGGDRLHMAYSFDLLGERRDAAFVASTVRELESRLGDGWPCWSLGNHDVSRVASRWASAAAHPNRFLRSAMALLFCLRGSVCLYQGEEFGFRDGAVTRAQLRDPFGIAFWPEIKGRDGCRTPIAWSPEPGGGFSEAEPWLPVDADQRASAATLQSKDEDSMLHWTRRFLAWRGSHPVLRDGTVDIRHDNGMLVMMRSDDNDDLVLAFNLSDEPQVWHGDRLLSDASAPGANGRISGADLLVPANGMMAARLE